jgi:hypothetical protein
MGNNNTHSTTIEDVYEEDIRQSICIKIEDAEIARGIEALAEETQSPRIGILDEIEDKEIARRGAYGGQSPRIGILDEIEDKEIARQGAYGGQSPRRGGASAIMDTINTSTPIEDRIRILSDEMIMRGLETEESFKRLRSYEKKRGTYRCLIEELARYYDRQTVLGLPIERPVLKTGIYMQHVILI